MAKAGDVLEIPELGVSVTLRETGEQTGGERLVLEVLGRPKGFFLQEHVHLGQVERHEVLSGQLNLEIEGREHLLSPGQSLEVPAGTPHRQLPAGPGAGRVRIELRPAGRTQELVERLAVLSREGRFSRRGLPTPRAGAELVRDFGSEGLATRPPAQVQRALAAAVLAGPERLAARLWHAVVELARSGARRAWRQYVFVDEWDVGAPIEAVHATLADARTYPDWWRPVYIDVDAEGPAELGSESRQHFKGRLPYELRTRSRIVRLEPPRLIEAEVDGDLRGRGRWTLTAAGDATHVRFDWHVHADRPLLRALTPALRPLLRWNHAWAIARARDGLEPYARRAAAAGGPTASASAPG